jgi:hypothetical protein
LRILGINLMLALFGRAAPISAKQSRWPGS